MNEVTCASVHEAAAEYALGILPDADRAPIAAHLLRCPDCRREVEELGRVGDDLLDLIPAAEPPLGFDRRVLSTVAPDRGRLQPPTRSSPRWVSPRRVLPGLAGVAATAGLIAGLLAAGGGGDHPHEVTAALVAAGHPIGTVYTEGRPPWIWMNVEHAPLSGHVTCDLIEADHSVVRLGSFDLVGGSGSWGAPEPGGAGRIVGARLVSADGQVIAAASFGPNA